MNAAMVTAAATEKPSVHIHRRLINFHSLNIIFGSFSSAWKIMYETLRQTMATSLCMCGVCVCVYHVKLTAFTFLHSLQLSDRNGLHYNELHCSPAAPKTHSGVQFRNQQN